MKACRILAWLYVLVICASFFWTREKADIALLAEQARVAMQQRDYHKAQEAYCALMDLAMCHASGSFLPWQQVIDYAIHLARAYELGGAPEKGLLVLANLLDKHPPDALTPKLLLMRARLTSAHTSPASAYITLCEIADVLPTDQWSKEDLSFLHALSYALDEYLTKQLQCAKRYMAAGYYEEAMALYQEVLQAVEHPSFPQARLNRSLLEKKARYALAECHVAIAQSKSDSDILYWMACRDQQRQEYQQVIEHLGRYTHLAKKGDLSYYDHALFEIGFFYYQSGQFDHARHYFERLQRLPPSRPQILGSLYLARLWLSQGAWREAAHILKHITCPKGDPLQKEWDLLQCEAARLACH